MYIYINMYIYIYEGYFYLEISLYTPNHFHHVYYHRLTLAHIYYL